MTDIKQPKYFDVAEALAVELEKMATYDPEKGNIVVDGNPTEAAVKVLDDKLGLNLTVEQAQNTLDVFLPVVSAAANLATGHVAFGAMETNKEIQFLEAKWDLSKTTSLVTNVRQKYETNPPGKPDEVTTHYGRVDSSLKVSGVKSGDTTLSRYVRDRLYEEGEAKLK